MMTGRWLTLLGVCLIFFASGCGKEPVQEERPSLVRTQRAAAGEASEQSVYAGTVCGRYESDLSFQVGGQILSRNVQAGDRVRAGDVLMVIDPRDVVQQTYQTNAQVESARAQLELARTNLTRYQQLYEEEAVAASVLDQYRTNYDAALAAYESASAQAAQAQHSMEYTRLTAPADGVISNVRAEAGQVIAAGQTALTLVRSGELEVEINVPEQRLASAVIGAPAEVGFWSMPDTAAGVVREVSPMADAAARTYRVRISLPEPPAGVELGMTANVSLKERAADGQTGGVVLPMSAIYQTGDTAEVWIVEQGRVHRQPVRVEYKEDNSVIVWGVAPGSVVVTAGVRKLHEGQEVRTEEESAGG